MTFVDPIDGLPTPEEAARRRDHALTSLAHSTNPEYLFRAWHWIEYLLPSREFKIEELRAYMDHQDIEVHDRRCLGHVTRAAQRVGLIIKVGHQPALTSNLSDKPLWRRTDVLQPRRLIRPGQRIHLVRIGGSNGNH